MSVDVRWSAVRVAAGAVVVGLAVGVAPGGAQESPPPVRRVLVVGDSVAVSLAPYLVDSGAARGVEVFAAARNGCSVITGQPVDEDGRAWKDVIQDTTTCPATTGALQEQMLSENDPDLVVWISGWEAWPRRVIDDQTFYFGTIAGNLAVELGIDQAVRRLTAGGARLVILPVPGNAYPSERGIIHFEGDLGKVRLARVIRSYVRRHPEAAAVIDLDVMLCPEGPPCPADVNGIRPRPVDGFHFSGPGAAAVAEQLMPVLLGPPPPPPAAPAGCAHAGVGAPKGAPCR